MTGRAVLEKLRGVAGLVAPRATAAARWVWSHRELVLVMLLVLAVALAVRLSGRAVEAEAAAAAATAREAGEARAAAAGVPVVHPVPPPEVVRVVEQVRVEDPVLRRRLEEAEHELGRLRFELAAQLRAPPGPAEAPVAKGDPLELSANLVMAVTPEGAHVLEGSLAAVKLPSRELILRQPFSYPLTLAVQATPAAPCPANQDRPWRLGAVGGVSGQGWLAGAAYTRRLDVWGWRPELLATAAGGPGGAVLLVGAAF